ncbi:MAG: hypothetical protein LBL90_11835 [Prevotellaceae bacterium]|jgi:hypothetical protein|nr:hypothetical protein [Prevotellaceae bacterium]
MLEGFSPNNFNYNSSYYDEHMQTFAIKMDEIIDTALSKIDIIADTMLWGFSIKMDGWIVSSIIADKIKRIASIATAPKFHLFYKYLIVKILRFDSFCLDR